jgi:hypothetical protein
MDLGSHVLIQLASVWRARDSYCQHFAAVTTYEGKMGHGRGHGGHLHGGDKQCHAYILESIPDVTVFVEGTEGSIELAPDRQSEHG